ncbi:EKC/KEOPS complex subunit LAGE3-like [Ctenodactylus gundi]
MTTLRSQARAGALGWGSESGEELQKGAAQSSPPVPRTGQCEPRLEGGVKAERRNLSFPFPTPLEAEIACGSLAPDAEPHGGVVGKELTVSGSTLAVNWTAEDSRLLRISIINFLEQLSLVVRTIQRFGPPVSR